MDSAADAIQTTEDDTTPETVPNITACPLECDDQNTQRNKVEAVLEKDKVESDTELKSDEQPESPKELKPNETEPPDEQTPDKRTEKELNSVDSCVKNTENHLDTLTEHNSTYESIEPKENVSEKEINTCAAPDSTLEKTEDQTEVQESSDQNNKVLETEVKECQIEKGNKRAETELKEHVQVKKK